MNSLSCESLSAFLTLSKSGFLSPKATFEIIVSSIRFVVCETYPIKFFQLAKLV